MQKSIESFTGTERNNEIKKKESGRIQEKREKKSKYKK